VDTKYEFGKKKKESYSFSDEILHSSLFFYTDGYQERQDKESKSNCLRVHFNQNGFQGLEGQQIPDMTEEYIETVSGTYIELYENPWGVVRNRHFKYQ
jgi:phosphoribosylaminoimidazole-succinocarboxamide synthase